MISLSKPNLGLSHPSKKPLTNHSLAGRCQLAGHFLQFGTVSFWLAPLWFQHKRTTGTKGRAPPHPFILPCILDQSHDFNGRNLEGRVSSSPKRGLYRGRVGELNTERERNTERVGHTGTKEATVGASSGRVFNSEGPRPLSQPLNWCWLKVSQEFASGKPSSGNRMCAFECVCVCVVCAQGNLQRRLYVSQALTGHKSGSNPIVVK